LLALAWLTAGPALGQIKLPIYDPDDTQGPVKGVTFSPATERTDFKHGTLLRVTLKDNRVVRGTLVRADKKTDRLYIRTEPGMLPTAVSINDIKADGDQAKVEKGLVEVAKKPEPGSTIKPVGFTRERVVQPEIFTTTVEQGPFRSSYYTSTVLSPQEKSALTELSQAEREVARLEVQGMIRAQETANENAMMTERLRTQELLNLGLAQQLYYSFPPWYGYGNGYGYGPFGGWMYGRGFGLSVPDFTTGAAVAASGPVATPPRPAQDPLAEALTKARERLSSAQARAIYEDGQVIAVAYEPKEK